MKISDIPEYHDRREILTMSENVSVYEASKKMKSLGFGAVVITDHSKVTGIFTERDVLNKVVAEGEDYKKLKLKDVMTKQVRVAMETDSISDSLRRMSQGRFRHLPIVDENESLIGMVSQGDFVAITWPQILDRFKSKTQSQFLNHTQLWMMVIVILAYFTIAPLLFK